MTHLEMAGLLFTKQEFKNSFPTIRRFLNLSINEEDETGACQNASLVLGRLFVSRCETVGHQSHLLGLCSPWHPPR